MPLRREAIGLVALSVILLGCLYCVNVPLLNSTPAVIAVPKLTQKQWSFYSKDAGLPANNDSDFMPTVPFGQKFVVYDHGRNHEETDEEDELEDAYTIMYADSSEGTRASEDRRRGYDKDKQVREITRRQYIHNQITIDFDHLKQNAHFIYNGTKTRTNKTGTLEETFNSRNASEKMYSSSGYGDTGSSTGYQHTVGSSKQQDYLGNPLDHLNVTSDLEEGRLSGGPGEAGSDITGIPLVPHLPDVLIIGAKKAGTRALLEFLRIHPLVRAARQELHFFDRHYHLGTSWYRKKLPSRAPGQLTVEKTPAYLVSPQVPGRVRELLPRVRLLLVVREPATRALSDYAQGVSKHSTRKNFTNLVFSDRETGLVNVQWGPVAGGLYARHLQRWRRYFPPASLHVVSGEGLVESPAEEMRKVEEFLGLPRFITTQHFVFNKTKGFPCILRNYLPGDSDADGEAARPRPPASKASPQSSLRQQVTAPAAGDFHPTLPAPVKSPTVAEAAVPMMPTLPRGVRPHCLGSTKGRDHPEVDRDTFKILQEFYRPFNHKFFRMIGKHFNWN